MSFNVGVVHMVGRAMETFEGLKQFNFRSPQLWWNMISSTTWIVGAVIVQLLMIVKSLELCVWVFEKIGPEMRQPVESGAWAIITGGSDGIGKGMALKAFLAGQNLVLVGRSKEKLEQAATEIKVQQTSNTGSEVIIFVCDLNNMSEAKLDEFSTFVSNLKGDVGLLVNSAGVSYDSATPFEDLEAEEISTLINLNLTTTIRITQRVYQLMLDNRNTICKGIIVCLGSGSASIPSDPLYSVYAASKAGVAGFCESLKVEGHMTKIIIQCHTPLMVPSKLSKARVGPMVPTLESYIDDAWKHVCSQIVPIPALPFFGYAACTPTLKHKLIVAFANIIPRSIWDKIRWGQNEATHARYLRKMEVKLMSPSTKSSAGGKITQ